MGVFEGVFADHDFGSGGATTGIWTTLAMVRSFGRVWCCNEINAGSGFRKVVAEVSIVREHMT